MKCFSKDVYKRQIPSRLEPDVEKAIRSRIADGTGNLYVLVNYTALYDTHNILKKLEQEKRRRRQKL